MSLNEPNRDVAAWLVTLPPFRGSLEFEPSRQDVENSGIYFVGFHSPVTGQLRQIGKEAIYIADDVARRSAAGLRTAARSL